MSFTSSNFFCMFCWCLSPSLHLYLSSSPGMLWTEWHQTGVTPPTHLRKGKEIEQHPSHSHASAQEGREGKWQDTFLTHKHLLCLFSCLSTRYSKTARHHPPSVSTHRRNFRLSPLFLLLLFLLPLLPLLPFLLLLLLLFFPLLLLLPLVLSSFPILFVPPHTFVCNLQQVGSISATYLT